MYLKSLRYTAGFLFWIWYRTSAKHGRLVFYEWSVSPASVVCKIRCENNRI